MSIRRRDIEGAVVIFAIVIPGAFLFILVGNMLGAFPDFEFSLSYFRGYLFTATLFCTLLLFLWVVIDRNTPEDLKR